MSSQSDDSRHDDLRAGSLTEGLPVAPSMAPTLLAARVPLETSALDGRVVMITGLAILIAFAAALIAQVLTALIGLVTNLAFYGRISTAFVSPADHRLGLWAVGVPVLGGIVVGLMARYGSKAIRGHGIPEAMEQVLTNESRIPPRLTFLKPLSSAIAIGTGGPFGAEGPIIATGGALGSLVGQVLQVTALERKTLLAAGAAAGMSATFGSPVSAVLLALELLLFEFRARSLVPVAMACATATSVRYATLGARPVFPMPDLAQPGGAALAFYILLGGVIGVASVYVTRLVYAIEDAFEKLPVHWMWWPALGGLAVGAVGYLAPRTLGVGYDNIEHILGGTLAGKARIFLFLMKLVSWSISLGSGTSGGTLAPLFTIGGGLGGALGAGVAAVLPGAAIDVRVAALVGMAAMFAGASRAVLTSVVFAFETTLQPMGLLPLLGGCITAYLVSSLLMKTTIMTEKISRRGVRVPAGYDADPLDSVLVKEVASSPVVSLSAGWSIEQARSWLTGGGRDAHHQGFPILGADGRVLGVLTRRDLLEPSHPSTQPLAGLIRRPPAVVFEDSTLREATDHMVREGIGRLPVVSRGAPGVVIGILTRSDLLSAHGRRLDEAQRRRPGIRLWPARARTET